MSDFSELEHRVFHDTYKDTLDIQGCHFGQMHKQSFDGFVKKYDSKMEDFQVWQTIVRDKTLPRIGDKAEEAYIMSKDNAEDNKILRKEFHNIWWKLVLINLGGGGLTGGVFLLVLKMIGVI